MSEKFTTLGLEIESALNRVSAESESNTPDFILAQYLIDCLKAWNRGVSAREEWYGRQGPDISSLGNFVDGPDPQP